MLLAVGAALVFETADLAVKNLEGRYPAAVPLSYLVALLPFALALGVLAHRGIGFSLRRPALAVAVR